VLKEGMVFVLAACVGIGAGVIAMGKASPPSTLPAKSFSSTDNPDNPSSPSPWNETFFPNDPVVTHDGRTLRFYDDLIRNKLVVVNFIYTSCSNICPLVTARLSKVKDILGDRFGRDIFFVSISIDPVTDGPEVLKTYADTYNTGPGWTFVTGEPEHIDNIRLKLGQRSNVKAEHRNDIMIGNDRTGTWGRDSAFSDLEVLAKTIQSFDPDWRQPPRVKEETLALVTDPGASYQLHNKPGTILFAKACAGCHSIGYGNVVGPDLAGILDRRDHDWLRRFLREPDVMRGEKDPLAVTLDQKYPGARMPNLGLSDNDIDDLFAYFASHTTGELAASGVPAAPATVTAAPR